MSKETVTSQVENLRQLDAAKGQQPNAPALGWVRTVNGEHWHWEQRPADAANGYKLPGVNP